MSRKTESIVDCTWVGIAALLLVAVVASTPAAATACSVDGDCARFDRPRGSHGGSHVGGEGRGHVECAHEQLGCLANQVGAFPNSSRDGMSLRGCLSHAQQGDVAPRRASHRLRTLGDND